jgi:hypothetical protein
MIILPSIVPPACRASRPVTDEWSRSGRRRASAVAALEPYCPPLAPCVPGRCRMCYGSAREDVRACRRQAAAILCMVLLLLSNAGLVSAQIDPGRVGGHVIGSVDDGPLAAAVRRAGKALGQSSGPVPEEDRWIVRHPVLVGTLIGTGAGLALSRVDAIGGANHDPRVALIGAGVGAWGGLIASAVHKSRAKRKIGIGTKIGIASGAVALIVLPVLACYGAGGCGAGL